MVLKKQTVEERLRFLKETLERLDSLKNISKEEFIADFKSYWLAEHGLHLAVEAVFDIGNHILVGHFGDRVSGYNQILERLAEKKVISEKLIEKTKKMGGFRNILVHEYMDVDQKIVYERIQNGLEDLKEFGKEILKWLKSVIPSQKS